MTVMHDGARLFVASYLVQKTELDRVWRCGFHALLWLNGGQAALQCDGEHFDVHPPSLICLSPGQVYRWSAADKAARATLIGFEADLFTAGRAQSGLLDVQLLHDLPLFQPEGGAILAADKNAGNLDSLFIMCRQRYQQLSERQGSKSWRVLPSEHESVLLAYLHVILVEAASLAPVQEQPRPAPSTDLRLSRLFRLHAGQRVVERLPVAYYAELLHVTPDHLTRAVRRSTGQTPSVWLQKQLLIEARRRLILTDQPVERVAEALNFGSASQFSQWVRVHTGQSPRQLRQQGRGKSTVLSGN
ncbi:helix-turn-helix domain-containing protein [Deinococcus hopiensis]|uniref:Transcriptional regulator, AraC family n=1 Tax=Deinococcus hopiensis KR-140 TaxID=695939 RepID=A0A1W1UW84_9DEIO|nr:AraC family transcriptional regulator [Deinococcus hopiensis]SMB85357.1 transcriptional regulator, AraC family [Deinococcus hopiensis KR-140]